MHISAKTDYALRAVLELAVEPTQTRTAEQLATAQDIPKQFLTAILADLKRHQILRSQRGSEGGYRLARPAEEITMANVMRAVEGQLVDVRGIRPEHLSYEGQAIGLRQSWVAVRSALRSVIDHVTIADILSQRLPAELQPLVDDPTQWQ